MEAVHSVWVLPGAVVRDPLSADGHWTPFIKLISQDNSFLGFTNESCWAHSPSLLSSALHSFSFFCLHLNRTQKADEWFAALARASLCWSLSEPLQLVFPTKQHPLAPAGGRLTTAPPVTKQAQLPSLVVL